MSGNVTAGRPSYPGFLAEGKGRCAERGNRDDFTNESNRTSGWQARERAKSVCRMCEFREPCEEWAIATDQVGVYGATTTRERRARRVASAVRA